MFILYAFLVTVLLEVISLEYLKIFQLNAYNSKVFLRNLFVGNLSFGGKNKLVFTKRMWRLMSAYFILIFAFLCLFFGLLKEIWLMVLLVLIFAIFLPIVLSLANLIMLPIENLIKKNYIKKTCKKLNNFKGKKVAITGSFGKTSVKNFLFEMVKDDFKTVMSPKNFNTPMGVCKTVLEEMKDEPDLLIIEMGARKEGDIRELMEMVNPDFGIMTAIGPQHLETFGSLDKIKSTKYELVKHMKPEGILVFDGMSEFTFDLFEKCKKKKFLVGDGGFAYLDNLEYSSKGSSFDLFIDDKHAKVSTRLLGKHATENIVLASTMAYLLGVDFKKIVTKISELKPVKSRLELIYNGVFTIIDDSYNSNPSGAEEAMNVLDCFEGEKIVISSGLVELGAVQYEKNFNLGKKIATVADKVVIMNETNKKALYEGLIAGKFDKEKIFFANTRNDQKNLIKKLASKGCVVLFQNDLPDSFK